MMSIKSIQSLRKIQLSLKIDSMNNAANPHPNTEPNPEPNTEPNAELPEKNRRRVSVLRSLAASIVATVAGNAAIIHLNDGALSYTKNNHEVTTTDTTKTGYPRLQEVTSSEGLKRTYTSSADWARQYEGSVGPESLDYSELDALVNQAKELSQPITIRLSGHASAEDTASTDDPNVGMATDNPSNINTAKSRADMLQQAIQQRFASENIQANIEFANPQEDKLSPEEIEYVNSLAAQQGYESTTAMVKKWNRDPSSVSPAVHAALMLLLGDERYVTAEISGTIDNVSYICVLPVIEETRTDIDKSETEIPFGFPILIPLFKKKKGPPPPEPEDPEDPEPEDPEDPEDPPPPPPEDPVTRVTTTVCPPPTKPPKPIEPPEPPPPTEPTEPGIGNRTRSVAEQLSRPEVVKSPDGKLALGFFDKYSKVFRLVPLLLVPMALGAAWYTAPIELDNCSVTISKGENEWGSLDTIDIHWQSCGGGSQGSGHDHAAEEPCGVDESIVQTEKKQLYFYNGELVSADDLPADVQNQLPG